VAIAYIEARISEQNMNVSVSVLGTGSILAIAGSFHVFSCDATTLVAFDT
jgi:hypothetical protein